MADVINLRRARKEKAKRARDDQAAANRARHGLPKAQLRLSEAERERQNRDTDAKKLEPRDWNK